MEINRKFLIQTVGCKVNQIEGQSLREKFLNAGFEESSEETGLDIVILNTCTVTGNADKKCRSLIRRFHRLNPQAKILVTGCYAEKNCPEIEQMEGVHLVVSQSEKEHLLERFLNQDGAEGQSADSAGRFQNLPVSSFENHVRAFLKIQDGCSWNCSYCKVKLVRGSSKSRPLREIREEAERLIASGHREIVLTGIQLGAYGRDLKEEGVTLETSVREILKLPGLLRIRLSSIEPGDLTSSMIELMSKEDRIAKHLHIPMQSGSDAVLKRMKRGYTSKDYLDLIERIKSKVQDFCLSMDVMAGFPGESEEDFEATLRAVEKARPLKVHAFPYSPREGTPAYEYSDPVPQNIKDERMERLLDLAVRLAKERKEAFLGRELRVLFEEFHVPSGCWRGHTTHYLPVTVNSDEDLINREVTVLADGLNGDFISSSIFSDAARKAMLELKPV